MRPGELNRAPEICALYVSTEDSTHARKRPSRPRTLRSLRLRLVQPGHKPGPVHGDPKILARILAQLEDRDQEEVLAELIQMHADEKEAQSDVLKDYLRRKG